MLGRCLGKVCTKITSGYEAENELSELCRKLQVTPWGCGFCGTLRHSPRLVLILDRHAESNGIAGLKFFFVNYSLGSLHYVSELAGTVAFECECEPKVLI